MGESNIFTLCVSPHLDGGGGGTHPRSGQGYTIPGLDGGTDLGWGGTPSQDWMGYPLPRTGWLLPDQDWMGPPPPNKTEQHNEHLLCGRQLASYIHAGGLLVFRAIMSPWKRDFYACYINDVPINERIEMRKRPCANITRLTDQSTSPISLSEGGVNSSCFWEGETGRQFRKGWVNNSRSQEGGPTVLVLGTGVKQ